MFVITYLNTQLFVNTLTLIKIHPSLYGNVFATQIYPDTADGWKIPNILTSTILLGVYLDILDGSIF